MTKTRFTDDKTSENFADRILAAVPEWFIPLGAGSLAAAAFISLAALVFVGYSLGTDTTFSYTSFQLMLAGIQLTLATATQIAGVYFALKQRAWGFVMLACLLGSTLIVPLPFTAAAVFFLGLSQPRFRETDWSFDLNFSLETSANEPSDEDRNGG